MMKIIKIFGLIILLFVTACGARIPDKNDENVASQAPDFKLKKLGGTEYVALAELSGKPVFIDFWASWCPPCRNASPYVEKLYEEFDDKAHVIGINLDSNPANGLDFVKKMSIKNLQLEGAGTDVPGKYGVSGIPAFFILNQNGVIIKKYVGFAPQYYNEWVEVIDGLLSKIQ